MTLYKIHNELIKKKTPNTIFKGEAIHGMHTYMKGKMPKYLK